MSRTQYNRVDWIDYDRLKVTIVKWMGMKEVKQIKEGKRVKVNS